jgi:3-dehydroquinate synthase
VRALLNLGHTFGHALEAANDYRSDLLHGEAVSIGMALAFRYGAAEGITPAEDAARVRRVLEASGLQAAIPGRQGGAYTAKQLVMLMQQDKKASGGKVPLILAHGIGKAYIHPDADLAAVETFLRSETLEA